MNNKFEPLNPNDVVSIDNFSQVQVVVQNPMLKVKEFESKAKINLLGTYTDKREVKWVTDGVNCEILKPGGDWQKGKVRLKICLEFCPDEPINPPSPLDDLRQKIQETEN